MNQKVGALFLALLMLCVQMSAAFAAVAGTASSYEELVSLAAGAQSGDVIYIAGDITAGAEPLTIEDSVTIRSVPGSAASISGLQLADASVSFAAVSLTDSLTVTGDSHIELRGGVVVTGADGSSGVTFDGSGSLLINKGCVITGGKNGAGVSISHQSGDFYGSIEGAVTGGSGNTGGPGVVVSPLGKSGTMMVDGDIRGGDGTIIGGHALNLFGLSSNAYITIDGTVKGGSGEIGGDGIQLVSASDRVNVGVTGHVSGGQGAAYGGDAVILMNADGGSSISLSGKLSGGDVTDPSAQPGTSLLIVGDSTASRTRVGNCLFEDGSVIAATPEPTATPSITPVPAVTPLPLITASVHQVTALPAIPEEDDAEDTGERTDKDINGNLPDEATPGEAARDTLPEASPSEAARG
ncbi:MAG: hypothetical protein J6K32_12020 [Clostridia bacterium]|nr:hypothetical protein [Clostridia bacterium]